MTLPLNSRLSALYDTNGTQKEFGFGFRVFFDPDNGGYGLEVRRQTADGYEVIPKSDYLVLPVEDNSAGVVRFSVAPSAGQQIYIAGKTPTIQQLVLTNFGRYSAESIETQFDFITAIIQEWLSALSEETRQRIAADDILTQYVVNRIDDFVQQVNQNWDDKSQEIEDYIATIMPSFTQTLREEIEAFAVAGMQDAIDQTLADSKAEIDDAVARANAAAIAAAIAGKVYDTPEAGVDPVTGVPVGSYFNVRSSSDESYVDEYQNIGGVPTPSGKRYLSALGVQLQEKPANTVVDSKGFSVQSILDGVYGYINVLSVFTKSEYDDYILLGEEYDATIPVQRAIDRAASENKRLFFPKLFNVFSTLILPEHVSFYGQGLTKNQTRRFSGLRSRASIMFQANPNNSTLFGYKRVRFNCSGMFLYGSDSIGFDQITLFGSEIFDNFIYNFATFINGRVAGVTHIHHNSITFITNHILADLQDTTASTLVDSYIHDNYLNAKATGVAVLLSIGSSSHFGINNNFFDYAYQCIKGTTPTAGTIHGNIFDVSYRGIRLDNGSSISISSNNFPKNFKAHASDFHLLANSPNKTLLETTDWKGIEIKSLQSSSIMGNGGDSESLIDISGFSIKGVRTSGNTNKLIPEKTVVINLSKGASLPNDLSGLRFEELEYRTVAALPTPEAVIGGAPVATYPGDIVVYNKQVLRNNGTAWRSLDDLGRVVFNGDQTLFFAAIDPGVVLVREVILPVLQVGAIVMVRSITQIPGSEYWAECNEAGKYNIYIRNNSNTVMSAGNRTIKVYAQNP